MPGITIRLVQPPAGWSDDVTRPYLVPDMARPKQAVDGLGRPLPRICPLCQVEHVVKTIHLWLGPDRQVTVSRGVFEELRAAGALPGEFEIVGEVAKPPPISLNQVRTLVDRNNRAIRPLTPMKPKGSG